MVGKFAALPVALMIASTAGAGTAANPASGEFAFASDRDGTMGIYVMRADGTGARRVTNAWGLGPSWSPDGKRLIFTSRVAGRYGEPNLELFTVKADGSGLRRITRSERIQETEAAWSPDGRTIAFTGYPPNRLGGPRYSRVYLMRADGKGVQQVASRADAPAWSPDGRQLAYVDKAGDWVIHVLTLNGRPSRPLFAGENPTWSPDGKNIAYDGVYVRRSDGSGTPKWITRPRRYGIGPAWSSDGDVISFAARWSGTWEIYTVTTEGLDLKRLTRNQVYDGAPVWRPAR
jgi:TolB protein